MPQTDNFTEAIKRLRDTKAFRDGEGACKTSQNRERDPSKWYELYKGMGGWIGAIADDRSSEECLAFALGWYFQFTKKG